jgi:hypothetical protein
MNHNQRHGRLASKFAMFLGMRIEAMIGVAIQTGQDETGQDRTG